MSDFAFSKVTCNYSESIKILHPIYDSLICFKSVKSQEIDYKLRQHKIHNTKAEQRQ